MLAWLAGETSKRIRENPGVVGATLAVILFHRAQFPPAFLRFFASSRVPASASTLFLFVRKLTAVIEACFS